MPRRAMAHRKQVTGAEQEGTRWENWKTPNPPRPASGQPIPIPLCNEPHLRNSTAVDGIAHFTGPFVSSGHASAPALSYQATLPSDNVLCVNCLTRNSNMNEGVGGKKPYKMRLGNTLTPRWNVFHNSFQVCY